MPVLVGVLMVFLKNLILQRGNQGPHRHKTNRAARQVDGRQEGEHGDEEPFRRRVIRCL